MLRDKESDISAALPESHKMRVAVKRNGPELRAPGPVIGRIPTITQQLTAKTMTGVCEDCATNLLREKQATHRKYQPFDRRLTTSGRISVSTTRTVTLKSNVP
jgi:hypothetical protein